MLNPRTHSKSNKTSFEDKIQHMDDGEQAAINAYMASRFEEALELYVKVCAILKSFTLNERKKFNYNTKYFNVLAQLGRCYHSIGMFEKAISNYLQVLDVYKNRMDIYYELALSFSEMGNITEAQNYAKKTRTIKKQDFERSNVLGGLSYEELIKSSNTLLGNMAKQTGDIESAKKYYEEASITIPLAEIAFQEARFNDAIEYSKKALKQEGLKDKNAIGTAYYYWAKSLIASITDSALNDTYKANISFAIQLFEKAKEYTNNPSIIYEIAYLHDDARYGNRNPQKAIQYYEQAAAAKFVEALHNLAIKYETGEDVEANPAKAFAYFKEAAELGYALSQGEMARLYLHGIGCTKDFAQARYWAEKAATTSPIAKYYLAILLFIQADEKGNQQLGEQAIALFKEIAEEANFALTNFNLGLIYDSGLFIPKNFELAEYYYREAIRLGHKQAADNLLNMYAERLEQAHISDNDYQEIGSACLELLAEHFQISSAPLSNILLLAFIKEQNVKRHSFSIDINESVKAIVTDKQLEAEDKILKILEKIDPAISNTINISTSILKIGDLLDKARNGITFFSSNLEKILTLLTECRVRLEQHKFSIRSICNIITGVSKFYRQGYHAQLDALLLSAFDSIKKQNSHLTLIDMSSLLAASIRTDLRTNLLAEHIQVVVDLFLNNPQTYLKKQTNIAGILYCLAVLDSYKRVYNDFAFTIEPTLLKPLMEYALHAMQDKTLDRKDHHQYFLAVFYFTRRYPSISDQKDDYSLLEHMNSITGSTETHTSILQKKAYAYIEQYLPGSQLEAMVNILPVDILWKNIIIQVDGPTHFIFVDNKSNHLLMPKDHFHDALLQYPLLAANSTVSLTNQNPYKIIHIDYREYKSKGNSYIDEELKKHGVTLNKIYAKSINKKHFHTAANSPVSNDNNNNQEAKAIMKRTYKQ